MTILTSKNIKFSAIILGITLIFLGLTSIFINLDINIIGALGMSLIISVFILTGYVIYTSEDLDKSLSTYSIESESIPYDKDSEILFEE